LLRERSGIFNLLVVAMHRLVHQGGFEYCEQSEQRMQEYMLENDTELSLENLDKSDIHPIHLTLYQ
jgi:hypothetical protein